MRHIFNGPKFPSISIPDSVISIGENAFGYCRSLTQVVVPEFMVQATHPYIPPICLPNTFPNSVTNL